MAGAAAYLKAMHELGQLDRVRWDLLRGVDEAPPASVVPPPPPPLSSPSPLHQQATLLADTQQQPVRVTIEQPVSMRMTRSPASWLGSIALTVGLGAGLVYLMSKGPGNDIANMRKGTHARAEAVTTKLADVVGLDEAKQEVRVLVDYLANPKPFRDMGARMPKGLLLLGPPGVGKTLLARAMAGEAGVPFFYISGSAVEELFVGLGAARLRALFNEAKAMAPAIIFVDEVDALGGKRDFSTNVSARQTLNQMLTSMDGFSEHEGVLVIAATNASEDSLDPAMLRSGRFDKKVFLHEPFRDERAKLFEYYLKRLPSMGEADAKRFSEEMAAITWGHTGADVANIVNQASILAVQASSPTVTLQHLRSAHADVLLGPANKSLKVTDAEKRLTAVHEAGHSIVALYTPGASPPREVTIVPRRNALGYMTKDAQDRVSRSREEYLAEIATAMGGRAAEELVYGGNKVTSGAASDFVSATRMAEGMVTSMGLSEQGLMSVASREASHVSEATKMAVDRSIQGILQERYDFAKALLREHSMEHKRLVDALMKQETLSSEEIRRVVGFPRAFHSSD